MGRRSEPLVPVVGGGEDRLSALLAVALVAANVIGGAALALLKALHVPPIVASPSDSRVASEVPDRIDPVAARPSAEVPGPYRR